MLDGKILIKRLCISAVIITIVYHFIFTFPLYLFVPFTSLFIVFCLYEFFTLFDKNAIPINKNLGMAFGALFPFFFIYHGEVAVFIFAAFVILFVNFGRRERYSGLVKTALTLFGVLYIGWLFSFFAKVRFLDHGAEWIAYVIWVTKMGDAGAYFIGSGYGKTKLNAQVSPKKSVEGTVGGFLFSLGTSLFFKAYLVHVPVVHFFILGILLGILTQAGDFFESMIKRELNIKDSGNIPGLGGIVDIVDSLLVTTPFLYYYLIAFIQC